MLYEVITSGVVVGGGLLAAKAARMKTTVVPDQELVGDPRLV